MQIICPFCKSVYDGLDKSIKNTRVECADCGKAFIADPIDFDLKEDVYIRRRNPELVKITEKIPQYDLNFSCLSGALRFFPCIPLVIGVLILFIGLISAGSNGASERTEALIPWIFSCFKWALILAIFCYPVARIIYLLECACQLLEKISSKDK